jgi:probable F420-dependent oxidoreductase
VADVRISVGLPQLLEDDGVGIVRRFAARAEELGFAGLWTMDSVPGSATSRMRSLEGLHDLTVAAVVTQTIRLGVAVIVLPERQPGLLARELATIDQISGGRLIVGVGVGRNDPATGSLGFPVERRVLRFRENLEVMRRLWAGDDVSHDGELYRFAGVNVEPKPVQRPGPPVWFGAGAPPALRRAAELGDGWMGAGSSASADFPGQAKLLTDALREAGRDPAAFPFGKRVYIAVEDTAERARERLTPRLDAFYAAPGITERVAVCGPAEACAEQLRELVAAGAEELLLNPFYDYDEQLEKLVEVAELVTQK